MSYHHGNLANALEDAAVELGRAGGPEAVVLREAARRAGVSPTAAYRHFAGQQALLERVKERALTMISERMLAAVEDVVPHEDPVARATARLRAAGRGYVDFARAEPGLFATAFRRTGEEAAALNGGAGEAGEPEADPDEFREEGAYVLLGTLIDDLVAAADRSADARVDAEYAVWAAVHGLSVLLLDGPLRHLDPGAQDIAVERTFDLVIAGLADGSARPPVPAGGDRPDDGN
jgi:AcrR family transcriptional regulator